MTAPSPLITGLQRRCTHEEFAMLVCVDRSRVTQLAGLGLFEEGQTALQWLAAYLDRLREQAAGRDSEGVLTRERAELIRSQRIGQDLKNAIAQQEYAPTGLLADLLAVAAAAMGERLDALPGRLKTVCPDLPDAARAAIEATVAAARDEWAAATADLTEARLLDITETDEEVERP